MQAISETTQPGNLALSIALVDDDPEYTEFLAQYLRGRQAKVDVFPDSNDLLAHHDPYGYDFYVRT